MSRSGKRSKPRHFLSYIRSIGLHLPDKSDPDAPGQFPKPTIVLMFSVANERFDACFENCINMVYSMCLISGLSAKEVGRLSVIADRDNGIATIHLEDTWTEERFENLELVLLAPADIFNWEVSSPSQSQDFLFSQYTDRLFA